MTGFGFGAPTSTSFGVNTQTTASPFGNDKSVFKESLTLLCFSQCLRNILFW